MSRYLRRTFLVFGSCYFGLLLVGEECQMQAGAPFTLHKEIVFESSERPGKETRYGPGTFSTFHSKEGRDNGCGLIAKFHSEKYKFGFSNNFVFETGDVAGLLGGIFRARCSDVDTVLERVSDDMIPKGAEVPKWDSITVQLVKAGKPGAAFHSAQIGVLAIDAKPEREKTTASVSVDILDLMNPLANRINQTAIIKTGDILLIRDKGHQIRAIVPANAHSRIVGWIELSPVPIPEAELVRNKKSFVRPIPSSKQ